MDQVHLLPSPLGCTPNLRETGTFKATTGRSDECEKKKRGFE